jgi:hypothetical protein
MHTPSVESAALALSPCGRGDREFDLPMAQTRVRGESVTLASHALEPLIRLDAPRRATFSHKGRRTMEF